MNPAVKPVVIAVTKSASTLLITFTGITIFLFASLRIYDYARVIQLNMEIALICAHVTLLFPNFGDTPIPMVSNYIHTLRHMQYRYINATKVF